MSYFESIILRDLAGNNASISVAGAVSVDGSGVVQPVSVTVLPLPTGAATEATLAALNTQAGNLALETTLQSIKTAVEIIDNFISGSKGLVTEDNSLAIKTAVETIDNFISGSRGLVTEDNSAAILTALGSIITSLAGTLTISGSVTANAGTNLNTSALALEATLQSVKNAVETIDNAISGSEMQVDIVTMPPITATDLDIRDLTATDVVTVTGGAGQVADVKITLDGEQVAISNFPATQPISAVSLPLPTGAATSTNQSTIIGHVDGIETLLGTIDADTSILAGAVSGSEMQVDIVGALPSGNNVIGQVKLTDGTDVADILDLTNSNPLAVAIMDSNGSQISSFGGGTEYTEDAASAANPVGGMIMAVRADSLAAVTTTDGDNIALRATNNGELYIKHVDSIPVTDNGGSLTIDATSLPLPTGAATAANQSTIIGHVDGIESLLTTIDSDTSNISTKIDTIAGAVSGTEMQVDVLTMPTVTVSATNLDIRDLSHSQDSVRIGDGTDLANVTAAGELNVLSTAQPGTDIGDVTINNASGGSAVNIQDGGNSITIDNTNLDTPLSTLDATLNTLLKPADTLAAITSITNVVHVDDNSSSLTIDDGGSSITVDGSISVSGSVDTELPAAAALADNTANPTAPAVGAFGMIWDGANWDRTPGNQTDGVLVNLGANNDVTVTSSALPSGAATSANQSTIIGHVDGIEALLTTIDADTSILSGAISGSEMQVDIVGAIPSGNNVIGQVKLTDGTDVADILDLTNSNPLAVAIVDSNGSQISSFGGGTEYTEDAASAANPVGGMTMAVRADSLAAVTTTDGDNIALRATNNGELYIKHVDSIPITDNGGSLTVDAVSLPLPTGASTLAEQQTQTTSLQLLDDTVATDGAATPTKGILIAGQDGVNAQTIKTDSNGELQIDVLSSALPTGAATAANQSTIIGHIDGIEPLLTTIDADTSNISTKIDTIAGAILGTEMQVDVLTMPTVTVSATNLDIRDLSHSQDSVRIGDGTDLANVTAAGELTVLATAQPGTDIGDVTINNASGGSAVNIQDGGNSITVDNGGTFVVQENGAALTSLQLIDDTVYTDNAGFTDNSSKILGVGYVFDETAGTALTENDIAAARIDSKRAIVNVLEDGTTRGLRQGVVDETGSSAVDAAAVGGGTPHDSVDSGNPIKIGGKAVAHGTNPTAVAAGDRTNAFTNVHGIPFSIGGHPNIISKEYYTTAAQTDDNILPAIAAGTIYVITCITVAASAANTVNTSVRIGFGTTTVPSQGASGADGVSKVILSHPGIAPGSGLVKGNGAGIVGIGGDDEELRITNSAPTTGSLIVQVDYFTISV